MFGRSAVDAVAQRSRGTYRLALGRVHIHWLTRRVTVDSIRLTTDTGMNRRRAEPLSEIDVRLDGCSLSQVQYVALARGNGLIAHAFQCGRGRLVVNGVRHPPHATQPPFLAWRGRPLSPGRVPRVTIDNLDFPDLDVTVRLPRRGGAIRFTFERSHWRMGNFDLNPADSATARRPLFSRLIELTAERFVLQPDPETTVRATQLRASLTDSTLSAQDIRADGFGIARARLRGVDFGAFVLGYGIAIRHAVIDSLRAEITSDDREPSRASRHRTPQQWIATLDQPLELDSGVVHDGEIVYREQSAHRMGPGSLAFTAIEAIAAPLSTRKTTVVTASALLQGSGRLDARFTLPLAAPRFDMTFSGALGPMPATAFNGLVERVYPWRFEHGQAQRIPFDATVRDGLAVGTVTPLYTGLAITVTGRGASGLVGTGGVIGDAARGVANVLTSSKIVENNPAEPRAQPRVGAIRQPFTPDETLFGFLWHCLRQGLLAVVRKS